MSHVDFHLLCILKGMYFQHYCPGTALQHGTPHSPVPPQQSVLKWRLDTPTPTPIWKSLPSLESGAENKSLQVGGLDNIKAKAAITTQLCLKRDQTPHRPPPNKSAHSPNYTHTRNTQHTHNCSCTFINACIQRHAHASTHCCQTPLEHLGRGHDESVTTAWNHQQKKNKMLRVFATMNSQRVTSADWANKIK